MLKSSTAFAVCVIALACRPALAEKPSELSPRFAAERADLLANCAVPIRQFAELSPPTPVAEISLQVEKGALRDNQVLTDDIKSVKFKIAKSAHLGLACVTRVYDRRMVAACVRRGIS